MMQYPFLPNETLIHSKSENGVLDRKREGKSNRSTYTASVTVLSAL